MAPNLFLQSVDEGFCRVYYKSERCLYCFMDEGGGNFKLYICTSEGEPIDVSFANQAQIVLDKLPPAGRHTSNSFREWIAGSPIKLATEAE